jgi:hypothetical protein
MYEVLQHGVKGNPTLEILLHTFLMQQTNKEQEFGVNYIRDR